MLENTVPLHAIKISSKILPKLLRECHTNDFQR